MLTAIENHEESQRSLAASLGKDYNELRGMRETEAGMLTLLWKAKSELYAQAIEVRAERQPLLNAQSTNIAGTRLKEKILAAIKRRKAPVEKAIKNFNNRRREYLSKYDPPRLLLPENKDLSYSEFLTMDLDDPLWNDNHFYHVRAPWAIDPQVRRGIKSVLFLDRIEEEISLLTQELNRSITWACEYCNRILSTIRNLEIAAEEPIHSTSAFADILPSFPMQSKIRLLHSQLKATLRQHEQLMLAWMHDVDALWKRTRSRHTKDEHPWFDIIGSIKEKPTGDDIGNINDALDSLTFQDQGFEREPQDEREWETDDDGAEDEDGHGQDDTEEGTVGPVEGSE
jgi:hypothetical protein